MLSPSLQTKLKVSHPHHLLKDLFHEALPTQSTPAPVPINLSCPYLHSSPREYQRETLLRNVFMICSGSYTFIPTTSHFIRLSLVALTLFHNSSFVVQKYFKPIYSGDILFLFNSICSSELICKDTVQKPMHYNNHKQSHAFKVSHVLTLIFS